MIYKIPIYFEVEVHGDFDPAKLSEAIDTLVTRHVMSILKEYGGFPHSTKDILDTLASDVANSSKVKQVKISLVPRTQIMKKIASHVK